MQAAKTGTRLTLKFSFLEGRFIKRSLAQIIANYQTKPKDLDPKAASVWYSTRGCQGVGMSAEETREWVENLHQYKSAHVEHLTKWSHSLQLPEQGQCQMSLELEDAPILVTALNDHRLLLAATHDIGQKEMDMRTLSALHRLAPARQLALSELHFLAAVIEEVLRFFPGNPADWMGTV